MSRPIRSVSLNASSAGIPKIQIAQIEASIRRFGHLQPLIIDGQSKIVCGVARFLASKSLQLARVPVIQVEHLTDDELRVFRLADNKLAEGASWNNDILAVELNDLLIEPECGHCQTNVAGGGGW